MGGPLERDAGRCSHADRIERAAAGVHHRWYCRSVGRSGRRVSRGSGGWPRLPTARQEGPWDFGAAATRYPGHGGRSRLALSHRSAHGIPGRLAGLPDVSRPVRQVGPGFAPASAQMTLSDVMTRTEWSPEGHLFRAWKTNVT